MSDFMKFLYANYIKPHLDTLPREDHPPDFSLLENILTPDALENFSKTQEFTAVYAFLLGLRTGQGLSDAMCPKHPA